MLQRATSTRPTRCYALLGLALVPLLLAAAFLTAASPSGDVPQVRGAIVNADEGVVLQGQKMPLGRMLATELVDGDREPNYSWGMADEAHAALGLADGTYAVVVRIPADFSANATSYTSNDASAHQARVDVESSSAAGLADTALGQMVALAAVDAFNQTLTSKYLDNIYVGLNSNGEQMGSLADGIGKLAGGSSDLASGLGTMAEKGSTLASGAEKLADGTSQLADGLGQLAANGGTLSEGTGKLADGLSTMADKGATLASGAGQLTQGTAGLASGLGTMATNGQQLADGALGLATGTGELVGGLSGLAEQTSALPDKAQGLATGVNQYVDGTGELIDKVSALGPKLAAVDTSALTTLSGRQVQQVQSLGDELGNLKQGETASGAAIGCPDAIRADHGDGGCVAYLAGVKDAGARAAAAFEDSGTAGTARTLDQSVTGVANTLAELASSLDVDPAKLEALHSAGAELDSGVGALADQLGNLSSGIAQLASGATKLDGGATQLADGLGSYMGGVSTVARNAGELAAGTGQFADGVTAYTGGVGKVADNAGTLSQGVSKYVGGVGKVADNVGGLASGAGEFAGGVETYTGGVVKVADGSGRLADGLGALDEKLAGKAGSLPDYTAADRDALATVVSSPVSTGDLGQLTTSDAGRSALVLTLALWLGAIAMFVLLRPVRTDTAWAIGTTPRVVARQLWPGLAIGIGGALAVAALAAVVVRPDAASWAALTGVLMASSVSFTLVAQAITAWLRAPGQILLLGAGLLSALAAVTHTLPAWLSGIASATPLAPAVAGMRGALVGEPASGAMFALAGWAVLGFLAAAAAILRARRVSLRAVVAGS